MDAEERMMTTEDRTMTDHEDARTQLVEVSRRLGGDPELVLHGGGNTSAKGTSTDVTGAAVETVWVKGSGWDLATITEDGFAPLRRERLLELLACPRLSDTQMVNELRQASLRADAPTASIEALLHAALPGRFVLHSHADAIVALTDQAEDDGLVTRVLGDAVAVLPYVKPGFDLARLVAEHDGLMSGRVRAVVLRNHGLFTAGDDAEGVLAEHLELVGRASRALGRDSWGDTGEDLAERGGGIGELAAFRGELSALAGRPFVVAQSRSSRAASAAADPAAAERWSRGTATPEHVIRTKREPLVGRDLAGYAERYLATVDRLADPAVPLARLDPAPRAVLDPEWGLLTAGATAAAAAAVHDIVLHTADIIDAADAAGEYRSLDERQSFEIEYWELEQARLAASRTTAPMAGEVALVTGAASGIGRAIAAELRRAGAAVVAVDRDPRVRDEDAVDRVGVVGDVSDPEVMRRAAEAAVRGFGGLDVLVAAAGVFPEPTPIARLDPAGWDRGLRVNTTAVAHALTAAHPALVQAPRGGRVVLVSSKNVAAPGPGAAAYSASKSAAAQLARVAALEWAPDGIRVNLVEPDAVFDTGIWTPELLAERAAQYGMSVQEYKTRNLLGVEVSSTQVAEAVRVLVDGGLTATTGAHLTVDGGNDRVV
ncbi:SDR family oxidoreductase [Mycetocola reblochoni]|uniref:3-oxoacyl-[acyl-carrier protein] reductase n=2 Tax=Mycetocola reblochoni TaxID=331618 RepID=A0A1R4KBW9_9MICO|nr:SDR family NAD(P)-dependent oxidoreductase [Mycetocola reblochoni]RLP68544.1 SDR family oxidoreductase [Mycetocola reblochoni]SJN41901.1 3-oxoacyl-[acyl-carrier protein] reductase [Mycetocola reblochoni REB411]